MSESAEMVYNAIKLGRNGVDSCSVAVKVGNAGPAIVGVPNSQVPPSPQPLSGWLRNHGHRYYGWSYEDGVFRFFEHPVHFTREQAYEGKYARRMVRTACMNTSPAFSGSIGASSSCRR